MRPRNAAVYPLKRNMEWKQVAPKYSPGHGFYVQNVGSMAKQNGKLSQSVLAKKEKTLIRPMVGHSLNYAPARLTVRRTMADMAHAACSVSAMVAVSNTETSNMKSQ